MVTMSIRMLLSLILFCTVFYHFLSPNVTKLKLDQTHAAILEFYLVGVQVEEASVIGQGAPLVFRELVLQSSGLGSPDLLLGIKHILIL